MKCPKCDKEIKTLQNIVSGTMEYKLEIADNGNEQYFKRDFVSDGAIDDFWCPECDEVLFTDDTKAVEFLKGGN